MELAASLQNVAKTILNEAAERADEGTLKLRYRWDKDATSEVTQRPSQAANGLDTQRENLKLHFGQVCEVLGQARQSLAGARAAWPGQQPGADPVACTPLARALDGRTAAAVRDQLDKEVFAQRQGSETHVPDGRRARILARVLNWLHTTGRGHYSSPAHDRHEQGMV